MLKRNSRFLEAIDADWILNSLSLSGKLWPVFFDDVLQQDINNSSFLIAMDELGADKYQELFAIDNNGLRDKRHDVLSFIVEELIGDVSKKYNYDQATVNGILNRNTLSVILSEIKDGMIGFDALVNRFIEEGLLKGELAKIFSDKAYRHKVYNSVSKENAFKLLIKLALIDSMPEKEKQWLEEDFGYKDMLELAV